MCRRLAAGNVPVWPWRTREKEPKSEGSFRDTTNGRVMVAGECMPAEGLFFSSLFCIPLHCTEGGSLFHPRGLVLEYRSAGVYHRTLFRSQALANMKKISA